MSENYNYFYDEYYQDMVKLVERFKNISDPHVVSIYRGSLPMGVHLSNALKCPINQEMVRMRKLNGY